MRKVLAYNFFLLFVICLFFSFKQKHSFVWKMTSLDKYFATWPSPIARSFPAIRLTVPSNSDCVMKVKLRISLSHLTSFSKSYKSRNVPMNQTSCRFERFIIIIIIIIIKIMNI